MSRTGCAESEETMKVRAVNAEKKAARHQLVERLQRVGRVVEFDTCLLGLRAQQLAFGEEFGESLVTVVVTVAAGEHRDPERGVTPLAPVAQERDVHALSVSSASPFAPQARGNRLLAGSSAVVPAGLIDGPPTRL